MRAPRLGPADRAVLETLRIEVRERGLRPVARDLGVDRRTLAAVLADVARLGSVLVVIYRARQHGHGEPLG